jgi:glycosyltransferase involved in cell wall biosynthesis
MAYYIGIIRLYATCPVLIRSHNVEYLIWERLAKGANNPFKRWYLKLLKKKLRNYEIRYYNLFDGVAAITDADANLMKQLGINKPKIATIPAGVLEEKFNRQASSLVEKNSIFSISALDWMPNIEALDWFLKEIWPNIHTSFPDLKLHIAGKSTPGKLLKLKISGVKIHGMVPDAVEFMQQYDIMVVPLLSGGGMRLKIIEAMALGKCIISTSIGAEGIEYTNYKNIIISDTPSEWLAAIQFCIENPEAKNEIGKQAAILAKSNYLNTTVTEKYIDFINSLIKKQ